MTTRPAAVAGLFYPGATEQLRANVDELLQAVEASPGERPRALIVPHAGYPYSGSTAAQAYRHLAPYADSYQRVVLLGPAHRVYVEGIAAPSVDSFSTPLGSIAIAKDLLANSLLHSAVFYSDEAHREEHSLEVHLPFLQQTLTRFDILPLLVGRCPPTVVAQVIDALATREDTLFIISTDLSHFHDYATASEIDRQTCERILAGATDLKGDQACGASPINGFLASRTGQNLTRQLVAHCNSGDTAGSRSRVVGYAAFVLY